MTRVNQVKLAALALLTAPAISMAAVPPEVATAISAAQTDVLSVIGNGFVYVGATAALMTVLMVFKSIIKKGRG